MTEKEKKMKKIKNKSESDTWFSSWDESVEEVNWLSQLPYNKSYVWMDSKKWHVASRLQHAPLSLLSGRPEASFSLGVADSGLTELSRIVQLGFGQSSYSLWKSGLWEVAH